MIEEVAIMAANRPQPMPVLCFSCSIAWPFSFASVLLWELMDSRTGPSRLLLPLAAAPQVGRRGKYWRRSSHKKPPPKRGLPVSAPWTGGMFSDALRGPNGRRVPRFQSAVGWELRTVFSTWCDREESELPAGFPSPCRSPRPLSGVMSVCRTAPFWLQPLSSCGFAFGSAPFSLAISRTD